MKHLMRIGLALTLALGTIGCGDPDPAGNDAGTTCKAGETLCNGDCCSADQQCNLTTKKCEPKTECTCAEGQTCGLDSCGAATCGSCPSGQTCNTSTNQCQPSTTCTCATGQECGNDSCGQANRCGSCSGSETCNASNHCEATTCSCDGKQCGDDGCGTSCGTCGSGKTCNAAGQCVTAGTCDPSTCAQGQSCYNPATGSTSGSTVCTCLPAGLPQESSPDTCAQFGLVCDYDYDHPAASTCKTPGAYDECKPASEGGVGCDAGLDCIGPFSNDNSYMCAKPCEAATDCDDLYEFCSPALANHCYLNWCYNPYDTSTSRADYFQPCNIDDTGDGTCTPLVFNDGQGGYLDAGLCWQAGTAPTHGACDPDATRANLNQMCRVNESCIGIKPGTTAGTTAGLCVSYCNAAPGPNVQPTLDCANGGKCLDATGLGSMNYSLQTRMGLCFDGCDMFGTACAANGIGDPQVCQPWDGVSLDGVCWPAMANGGSSGDTCAMEVENDMRATCDDGLYCAGAEGAASGNCYPYCDAQAAAGAAGACATGSTCSYADGQRIGLCNPDAK